MLSKDGKSLSVYESLIAGAFAGCLAVSVTYPTDLIRRKIQIEVIIFVLMMRLTKIFVRS